VDNTIVSAASNAYKLPGSMPPAVQMLIQDRAVKGLSDFEGDAQPDATPKNAASLSDLSNEIGCEDAADIGLSVLVATSDEGIE
jgi:hypothetical protein